MGANITTTVVVSVDISGDNLMRSIHFTEMGDNITSIEIVGIWSLFTSYTKS